MRDRAPAWPRRRRGSAGLGWRSVMALTGVIALHIALLWLLQGPMGGHAPRDAPRRQQFVTMRLIAPRPATLARPVPPRPETETPPRSRTHATMHVRGPAIGGTQDPAAAPSTNPAPITLPPEVARSAETSASAAPSMPSLMDTEATRRAIRASARLPSLTDQVAAASDEPRRASAQERLANDVKAAGKGECMKGEYLGAGMGILSIPFLAVAAARGACAR